MTRMYRPDIEYRTCIRKKFLGRRRTALGVRPARLVLVPMLLSNWKISYFVRKVGIIVAILEV